MKPNPRVIDDSPDWWDEYDTCHPACDCREKKVKKLVEAARDTVEHLSMMKTKFKNKHPFDMAIDALQAAIEGVKS